MFLRLFTDELDELNQIMVKQLKNRYSDMTRNRRFVLGVDRSKMRLFDCEDDAQDGLMQDGDISTSPVSTHGGGGGFSEFIMD